MCSTTQSRTKSSFTILFPWREIKYNVIPITKSIQFILNNNSWRTWQLGDLLLYKEVNTKKWMKEVETCNIKIQASVPKDKRAETIMVHRFNDKSSIFEKKKKKKKPKKKKQMWGVVAHYYVFKHDHIQEWLRLKQTNRRFPVIWNVPYSTETCRVLFEHILRYLYQILGVSPL